MKTFIKPLAILLIAQLAFMAYLNMRDSSLEAFSPTEALLVFDSEKVEQIDVSNTSQATLSLIKNGKTWQIPGRDSFPASEEKVEEFINKLHNLKQSYPVGQTESSQKQFKVADNEFERKVVIKAEGLEPVVLYLGESPGFKKSYVRAEGSENTFSAQISLNDADINPDVWIDREFLFIPLDDLNSVSANGFEITHSESGLFSLTDIKDGEVVDPASISRIANYFATLRFTEYLGLEKDNLGTQKYSFVINFGDSTREYLFFEQDEKKPYLLTVSDSPFVFKVARSTVDTLKGLKREDLLQKEEEETPENS